MKKKAIWPLRVVFCAVVLTIAIAIKGSSLGAAGENSQVYIGAWVGEKVNLPGDLDAFEWVVGKKMAIVHRYSGNPPYLNGEHFNVAWAEQVRARGSIPMLSWDPRLDDGDDNLLQAALGSRDDYIRLWARELKDWGRPIFFRMMWEQNCAWFPWTATVEPRLSQFKALWQRIVGIFREEGANNVTFVWSPHVSGFGSDPIMATYPGDAFVDWVALDGYPYKSGRGDFFETFKPDYDILVSQLSKPIMIAETSLDRSSDLEKSGIIADILTNQLPNNFPKVKALVWFDEIDCDGVNYSIMTDWGPLSQQAFRRGLESSYYASNNFSNLYTSPIPIAEVILHPPATATPTVTPLRSPTPTHNQGYDLAGNLVTNGDFESVGSGGLPSAWITTAHAECLSLDDSKAMAGSLSLKHYSNSGPSYVVYQEVPAYAGQGYSFIGWVNISNVTAYPRFSVQLLPMNSNNGVIKTITIATYTSVTDGWQEMRAENLVMPSGTVKARLAMKVDNLKGTINVDSFSLYSSNAPLATATETGPTATSTASLTPQPTPTEAATPTKSPTPDPLDERNLLVNPSFAETITGSDDPVGWSMSAWINPAYVSVDRFAGFDGDGLGLIIAGENSSYSVYQDVPIRGGGQYIFTGWVRVPFRPAGAFKVEISPMNQSGGLVGVPVNKGYYDSTTNWEQFTLKIIMPDSATVARVQLKAEGFRHAAHVDKLIFYCSDQTPTFTPTSSSTSTSTSTATATPMAMPTETMPAILTPTMVPTPWGNLLVNPSFRGGGE